MVGPQCFSKAIVTIMIFPDSVIEYVLVQESVTRCKDIARILQLSLVFLQCPTGQVDCAPLRDPGTGGPTGFSHRLFPTEVLTQNSVHLPGQTTSHIRETFTSASQAIWDTRFGGTWTSVPLAKEPSRNQSPFNVFYVTSFAGW